MCLDSLHAWVGRERGARLIADELIAQIRERVDIVALIGEYVTLKKRGTNHVGLCPFHSEKTPSFNVRGDQKYYHCFGCKESGDPISFLMRMDGLSFPQALRALAAKVGIEVPESASGEDVVDRRERDRRERLHALMDAATRFYADSLATPIAASAQAELARRAIGGDIATKFRLGYAPDAWDALSRHLGEGGWSLDEAEAVGLVARRRSGGHYDRFRHRLMFPVADVSGRVVAFSGRALPASTIARPDSEEPKYLNSPEGPLYHKGATLYGLHEGRVAVRRLGWALVCEGNFDLVALHQAGFENAVAPLGTAFTEPQAKLLRRFAQRVTLLFDADSAGRMAVRASFPVLRSQELFGRVAVLPAGEDPDSYLRGHGAESLRSLVDRAPGIVEFLIDAAAAGVSEDAAERAAAVGSLAAILDMVDNSVERELYIERVAQRFGIGDPGVVRRELGRGRGPARGATRSREAPAGLAPGAGSASLPPRQAELLGILLEHPSFFATSYARDLDGLLSSPELRELFRVAAASTQENGALNLTGLLSQAEGNPALPWLRERLALAKYEGRDHGEEALRRGIPLLAKENIERELPRLARDIAEARRSGDTVRADRLTREREQLARSAHQHVHQPTR